MGQKGFGLVGAVVMLAFMLFGAIVAAQFYYESMLTTWRRSKNQLASFQVLQDFAVLAQNANAIYIKNSNACPGGGYNQIPSGSPFCWSNAVNSNCVRNPLDTNSGATKAQFCLDDAPATMTLGIHLKASMREKFVAWAEEGLFNISTKILELNSMAFAASEDVPRPSLAGSPAGNDINIPACTPATNGDTYCKRCTGGAQQNVDCVAMTVCVKPGGCLANESVQQKVGIIAR